ncbi:hypothetical protein K470DRAFT_208460 [Piedraia hortae CBS 480.64]|uniref:Zn(2)-C6 fungal-type domain-containing protein n=1 Tax=Piedraia hortae CBS 480.64 TaxID=1314780 RepID=A0A6A7CBS2_9PEZI|nr:hypothetical protein K470DRAFT_208460 [Piedraia hortae CBS 480.64]
MDGSGNASARAGAERTAKAAKSSANPRSARTNQPRKRTKTGCLTCRKRRIKCDETRPICRNCIKSKRHCDGYNQPITFRPPTLAFPPPMRAGEDQSDAGTVPYYPQPASTAPAQQAQLPPHTMSLPSHTLSLPHHQEPSFTQPFFTNDDLSNLFYPPCGTYPPPAPLYAGGPFMPMPPPMPQQMTNASPETFWKTSGSELGAQPALSASGSFQPAVTNVYAPAMAFTEGDLYNTPVFTSDPMSPNHLLLEAAVERQDDDYYDVNSEDELEGADAQRPLDGIIMEHRMPMDDWRMRRCDAFIGDGMLATYKPEWVANPLKNAATARVFAHFIAVTGPGLSIFERQPRNTSILFSHSPIPLSQQGIWTYAMPMAALHHQGLLHAMLALSSLHIARLKNASLTPSMQHYSWALRRVHAWVGDPKRRRKVTTIAASLLLGFYEVMAAEHMKWNTHLAGSAKLFIETDFVSLTRHFCRKKLERAARRQWSMANPSSPPPPSFGEDELLDQIPDLDERLVGQLVGRPVRYHDPGLGHEPLIPPEIDLANFEMLKDVYWWYCKQDAYQSLISGNPLMLDYSRWGECPPRAAIGRADAVHGSFDHLTLLLGRIADFASRDRARKRRQWQLKGSPWNTTAGPSPQHVSMPAAYGSIRDLHAGRNPSPSADMASATPAEVEVATRIALEDHASLRAALDRFAASLGEAFQPLTSEYQPEMPTPFGPALFYRSYDIGCLWALYNMALIITLRLHPSMPPATHVAAGLAARDTEEYALRIGQISAGIALDRTGQPTNPVLSAALCESAMPTFFAAIQYCDASQRHFTIQRLVNIARRTGWGSVELIAHGIETAWIKAAQAGKGPPYKRFTKNAKSEDIRLNGTSEVPDLAHIPNKGTEKRAVARLFWAMGVVSTEADERVLGEETA